MSLLTAAEQAEAAADVRRLIEASGQQAQVLRRQPGENLFGHDDESYIEAEQIPIELCPTPPEQLPGGIDATASALPEAELSAQIRLKINEQLYRVQTVMPERLFGIVTHLTIELVRLNER